MNYNDFLQNKNKQIKPVGFTSSKLPDGLFSFQKDLVSWYCKRGRGALFAGTGMGKTYMQLAWANELYESTGGKTIIFTPLAVANQTLKEANRWGIDASKASNMEDVKSPITITNYHKLHHFDLSKFEGVVLDESSILKNESGYFRNELIKNCDQVPYRLAATATPSPNDFMELGNHSAFCGIMSYTDMLSTFFTHDGSSTQNWRLKGHAESEFWKWLASWSVMFSHPIDIGYDIAGYDLPKLHQIEHTVNVEYKPCIDTGLLFPMQAQSLSERLVARRATINERVKKAADIANDSKECFVVWCNLNDESKMLSSMINGAVELSGADSEEKKEDKLEQFANGNIRVLVTKPSLCGAGMNWQHCHNTIFVGLNDSFEQIYQSIRRFWRFGQKNEVYAHFIASEIEGNVVHNIKRKEQQCEHMMQQMINNMVDFTSSNIKGATRETTIYSPQQSMELPKWI